MSNRSRYRISLRVLLVALTCFCVFLAWKVKQAKNQKTFADYATAHGGYVSYDFQFDPKRNTYSEDTLNPAPDWLRRAIGSEYFQTVEYAVIRQNGDTDFDIAMLRYAPKLEGLHLVLDWQPDVSLSELRWCKRLRHLTLQFENSMERLGSNNPYEEGMLEYKMPLDFLETYPQLRELNVYGPISDLSHVIKSRKLESLFFYADGLDNLERLAELDHLGDLYVDLYDQAASTARLEDQLIQIQRALPKCTIHRVFSQ